jgi:hypothetical protein
MRSRVRRKHSHARQRHDRYHSMQPRVPRTHSHARRSHDRYHSISIARSPHAFTRSPTSRPISLHINRTFAARVHTLANVTIDITPYQSSVRRTRSRTRQRHDGYHPISIVRLPHPFTRSPRSRSISPHINRAFATAIHAFAKVKIDIAPYRSHVRRSRSHDRGGDD